MKYDRYAKLYASNRARFRRNCERWVALVAGLLPAVLLSPMAWAQCAQLRPGQLIFAGASPLAPGTYAIPCVSDWNGDGKKDLLVGYRTADKVALYLNVGTDANPVFNAPVNLQAGGGDLYVQGAASCGAPAPWAGDFNSDGKRDLLVGSGLTGQVLFFQNTNTEAAPLLAAGVALTVGSNPLSVGSRATPYVYDWDGDGLQDLLCGEANGYVVFFKNIGTAQGPTYATGTRVQAGGVDLNLGIRSVVRVCDWDGDGVKDLVGSSDSGVYWCRNTGSDAAPVLQPPVALRAPVSGSGLAPINIGPRMRLDLADWNNDGGVDLLVGNASGMVSLYEGYRFACTVLPAPGTGQHVLQWNSAPYLTYHVLAGTSIAAITNRLATNVASGGNTTSWTHAVAAGAEFYRVQIAP